MMIVHDFGIPVKEYVNQEKNNAFPTIETCPNCKETGQIIKYGFRERWCAEDWVWIKRYLCNACSKVFSLLPSFLSRGVGESLRVVEGVLLNRTRGKSYNQAKKAVDRPDLSYQRIQYWWKRWEKKSSKLRGILTFPLTKALDMFQHLSQFFYRPEEGGQLFENTNLYTSRKYGQVFL